MANGYVNLVHRARPLWLAFGFLTTLPLLPTVDTRSDLWSELGRAARWFPAIGLAIGLCLLLFRSVLGLILPLPLVSILLVAIWAVLTGGLHLDGLADCCDGLLASVSTDRRLAIMRDPRLGTFGATGLFFHLLLKVMALYYVLGLAPLVAAAALVLAPVWARWNLIWCARLPPARSQGMGAALHAHVTSTILWTALLLPVLLTLVAGLSGLIVAPGAVLTGWLVTVAVTTVARRRLGGVSGDLLGLVVETTEVTILFAFTVRLPWS